MTCSTRSWTRTSSSEKTISSKSLSNPIATISDCFPTRYLILEPVENAESSKRARHFANMDLSSVFANIRLVVDSGPDAVPREDKKEESPPVSLADTAVTVYHPVSWATLATTVKCTAASARYRPPKTSDGCNELVSLFHEMPFTDAIFSGNQVSRINFIRDGDFRRHEHDGDDLPKLSLGHMGNNFRFEVHAVGEASQALRRETIECLFSTGKMRNLPSTQWKGSLTMVPAMMNAVSFSRTSVAGKQDADPLPLQMARLVDKEFTLSDHGMPPILDLVPPVSTSDLISALKQCLPAYFAARREFYNSGRRLPALWEHNRAFDWTSRSNELRWDLIGGSLLPMLWIVGSENKQWVDVYCADVKLGNGMVQLGVFVCVIDSSDAPLVLERHYTELL